jgi:hypothetical protein
MEAGLYYAKSVKAKQKSLVFRHFPKAADAISQVQYWKRRAEKTEKKLKSN